ncbi:MAG: hypothetical protein WD602_07795 [Actinomycetota bacterium]
MTLRVAVLCWEESRPWVSALRQQGYSVPWVDEPKADVQRQMANSEPDVLVVDLTRLPQQGMSVLEALADKGLIAGIPVVLVTPDGKPAEGVAELDVDYRTCGPGDMTAAVQALAERQQA